MDSVLGATPKELLAFLQPHVFPIIWQEGLGSGTSVPFTIQ